MTTQWLVQSKDKYGLSKMQYFDYIQEAIDAYDAINGKAILWKMADGTQKVFFQKEYDPFPRRK